MKGLAIGLAAASLVLGGVNAAEADGPFELTVVQPATADSSPGIFRVDVATGQVVYVWGWGTSAATFAATADSAPLPPGDYHLRLVETLDSKGGWEIIRFDTKSGRTWSMSGGGGNPFVWTEATGPK